MLNRRAKSFHAHGLHQDLDARLEFVVTATMLVIHAQNGFQVRQHVLSVQPFTDDGTDYGCSPETTSRQHFQLDLARLVGNQFYTDIMRMDGRAVCLGTANSDLELAWQKGEFGVERGP